MSCLKGSKIEVALTFDDVGIVPLYSEIETRSNCNTRSRLTKNIYLNTPIIASPMDTVCGKEMAEEMDRLGGIGIIHRFNSIEDQVKELPNTKLKAAAVGSTGDWWERTQELIKNGTGIILIDVANGNNVNVKRVIDKIKSEYYGIDIIAGNVCTEEGARNLCEWGVDAVRAGIGGGSLCSTRKNTAIGVPQITALDWCMKACEEYDVPLISDGGVRYVGDICKAIGIGAETVMLGSLLAGTKESPGSIKKTGEWPNEQLFKSYRGSASLENKIVHGLVEKHVEGASKIIPYKGKVERIINDILDGLKSSMSYVNANNIPTFIKNCSFVQVTQAGQIEATPHLLNS